MATPLGLRQVKVFEDVQANKRIVVDDYRGAYLYSEVTNDTDKTVYLLVNDNPDGGYPGARIPILANSTRAIPVALYSFQATDKVTVVAYGM